MQLVLDAHAPVEPELAGPLLVDLALEIKRASFIGDVPRRDEEGEADPGEQAVDREEGTIIEEDARPSDERGEDAQGGGERGNDELGLVADTDDVGFLPDVEPEEKAGDKAGDGVGRELMG